jgi:SMODS-associated and fused to various effectors sensor domain
VSSTHLPSPSGARVSGDAYQHTFTWLQALRLLRPGAGVVRIGLEVPGAGNVDDVVVYHERRPPKYHQVKFAQSQGDLLTYELFMAQSARSQQSLLQRFYASFQRLTEDETRPDMALETNRWVDGKDPILAAVSGRAYKLIPRLRQPGPRSAAGRARAAWADHLGVDEETLFELLAHLEINPGRGSLDSLRRDCVDLHADVGLRADFEALDVGVSEIGRMIGEGVREVDAPGLREIVERRRLRADQRRATVVIEAIDHDPWPEAATIALDWVDMFEGEEPGSRCQLREPEGWNATLKPKLRQTVAALRQEGFNDVLVRGFMRLPLSFAVGYHFSDVAGFAVAMRQREGEWGTRGDRTAVSVCVTTTERGGDDELAVGISVANDIGSDVLAFLDEVGLRVGRFVNLRIDARGAGRHTIADAGEARGLAQSLVDAVLDASRETRPAKVHLFMSAPNGLALLLGHVWNRLPKTVVYEHRGAGRGYFATFRLGG